MFRKPTQGTIYVETGDSVIPNDSDNNCVSRMVWRIFTSHIPACTQVLHAASCLFAVYDAGSR